MDKAWQDFKNPLADSFKRICGTSWIVGTRKKKNHMMERISQRRNTGKEKKLLKSEYRHMMKKTSKNSKRIIRKAQDDLWKEYGEDLSNPES